MNNSRLKPGRPLPEIEEAALYLVVQERGASPGAWDTLYFGPSGHCARLLGSLPRTTIYPREG